VTALERMIGRGADVLREVALLDVSASVTRLRGADRILVIGTGTSHHAAELAGQLLTDGGVDTRAMTASAFADRLLPAGGTGGGTAAIVISHTGETAYARAARRRLLRSGIPLVTITGPAAGWAEAIVTPEKEAAETYTVSYLAALGVLGLLAAGVAGTATGPDALRACADRVTDVLADPAIEHVPVPARALALVGRGSWAITAREGALKLREGARMLCEGFDAERLLHGFAVPYGTADGLLLLQADADPDGLVAALGEAAAAEGIPVCDLAEPTRSPVAFLAQIPLTVRLQCLAARFARLRGTDPDTAITGAWARAGLWALGAPRSG
jgi:glucosamine--fructose-6-phosphate aminotransferase (isomerizing)